MKHYPKVGGNEGVRELPELKESIMTQHHWTGWPGASCFHCGCEDPMEYAVGMNYYDPYKQTWDTEEHRLEYEEANVCITTRDRLTKQVCPQCPV